MLIGLNGKLKSGKDTTYGIIQDLYPHAERLSFAEKLKTSAAAALSLPRDVIEDLKNNEEISLRIVTNVKHEAALEPVQNWQLTFRQYLQNYGTEAHRDIFGDNFWVDQVLPLNLDHSDRLLVVTDVRFPNEVERVIELGGIVWKVVREVETSFSSHPSEQNLDAYVNTFVDNTGEIYDLREKIKNLMNRIMVPC